MDYGHWITEINFESSEWFGFVYEIVHKESGRTYIGKKQLRYTNRKKVTGRKNRKKVLKESDWKTYTGSCNELNEEITEVGKEDFRFIIVKLCKTKRELGYTETELQIKNDVLTSKFPDGNRKYYNSNIMNRWFAEKE